AAAVVAPAAWPLRRRPAARSRSGESPRARRCVRAARAVPRTRVDDGDRPCLHARGGARNLDDALARSRSADRRGGPRARDLGDGPDGPRPRERPPLPAAKALRGLDAALPPSPRLPGHRWPRIVTAEAEVRSLGTAGLALGIEPGQSYKELRDELPIGGALVVYTDGVIEARHGAQIYGEERLDALLASQAGLGAAPLARAVVDDCRAFAGSDLADDCAVVVIRRT